jgi:hypothetical protein
MHNPIKFISNALFQLIRKFATIDRFEEYGFSFAPIRERMIFEYKINGLTSNFNKWDQRCSFIFSMDVRSNLVKQANSLSESDWNDRSAQNDKRV